MLDIKFIRENPMLLKEAVRKKRLEFDVDKLLALDEKRRALRTEVEAMRAEANATADAISKLVDPRERQASIDQMRVFKARLEVKEKDLGELDVQFQTIMYQVPNIPDPSVPEGESDADNKEIRRWGEAPKISVPKDHITLLREFDLADFERGTKVAGFRGYILKNEGALLEMAIWQFAFETLVARGFSPMIVPSLVREENLIGTGYLPQAREEIYINQDMMFFAGTAEVAVMGMYQGEIFEEGDLPKRIAAFSPCFRREVGSHGKDIKGLYRVHEFMKVEQLILCPADHMMSVTFHEELTRNAEEMMQALGLYYRVVVNCGGDLGLGQVKKYDIEAWVPSQERFGETHSASYFHDFQTRRLQIRYRDRDGIIRFAHSLNNTALATPRLLISILEQNLREDGTIHIPEPLQKYLGKSEIRRG